MAWTPPSTWVAGTVLTAAQLNQQIRDNMLWLRGRTAGGTNSFPTIAAANTTYTRAITFPASRFAAAPAVTATLATALASTASVVIWVNNITASGADVNIQRSATAGVVDFKWTAIEIDV